MTLAYADLRQAANATLTLSAKGGDGGDGGKGGDGGRGGDGGVSQYANLWGKAGQGGRKGPGSKSGYGGKGGGIVVINTEVGRTGLALDISHGRSGTDGTSGVDGADGTWSRTPLPQHGRPQSPPGHLPSRPPAQQLAVAPINSANSATPGSIDFRQFRYNDLRQHLALSQLRMLVERLRFLFLRLGQADLSMDPTEQDPDLAELLAGIQWIQDLLGRGDDHITAAFRDSLDGAIYFFRQGACLKYDLPTGTASGPEVKAVRDQWPGLWEGGDFDSVTLGYCSQGFDDNFAPRFGGVGMYFKSGEVIFHHINDGGTVTGSLEVVLGHRCKALWDGIDLAFNVTDDGKQGLLFKGSDYYRYTLGTYGFTRVEGPSAIGADFPGLWTDNVTAVFAGKPDCVFFFQKSGTYDDKNKYVPPQYMLYNFAQKKAEAGYPRDIAADWPGLMEDDFIFVGDDRSMAAALLQAANSLHENLRFEWDYFGNTSTFTPLGTVEFFDKAKEEALKALKDAESEYHTYQTAMNEKAQSQAGLQLAVKVAGGQRKDIEKEAESTLSDTKAAVAEINRLRDLLQAKARELASNFGDLENRVRNAWGVSWQDLFGCLTQFSFMHWNNLPERIESGPALMAAGQVGDLFQRGISNVVSDSGQPMSKTYLVKQVDTLAKEIRSLKDLTLTRSKFIDPTNLYNNSYKLMVTRDQFKQLCSDFTQQFSTAQKIIDDLDEYVSLADQRNAAVLEYNQLWQHVNDLQAEAVKSELDYEHAQSSLTSHAEPSLPVFTSFATERYRRALDETLNIFYLAGRAYILKSLEVRNFFSDMLRQLPAIGQIDAATFTQGQLNHLYNTVIDELRKSGPSGPCTAHVVFEKSSHPEIFTALADAGLATIKIPKATRRRTNRPFSGMANVRLTKVRCWAGGLAPRKKHLFTLEHTGHETFVRSDGKEVTVDHHSVFLDYEYQSDAAIDPTKDTFKFKGDEKWMPLTEQFALIGPFTTWNIMLDDEEDRKHIKSLRIEFDAMHDSFHSHSDA